MLLRGDCLEKLKDIETDSVDCLVTDPPYGYSFMGKDWDKAVVGVPTWKECLRVLKPGAFALVMSAPRQDVLSRMIVNLTDAGFKTDFTSLYWTYASGFPKAMNIGKAVDKRNGERAVAERFTEWMRTTGVTAKQINEATGTFMGSHYLTSGSQPALPTAELWQKIRPLIRKKRTTETVTNCHALEIPEWVDELIERTEAEREVVGQKKSSLGGTVAAREYDPEFIAKHKELMVDVTIAATPQAKALDGSYAGYQPKPAVEVILVCMKPLSEKTYVDQALKNGKGVTWLDDCRIGTEGARFNGRNVDSDIYGKYGTDKKPEVYDKGRFPANLLVSDDVLNDGKVRGEKARTLNDNGKRQSGFGMGAQKRQIHGDSGSYSRYFDLDSWWNAQDLPDEAKRTLPFLVTPKASKREKNEGLEGFDGKIPERYGEMKGTPEHTPNRQNPQKNHHPTCKPIKLMSYLITLGSREGDTILDPFMGSGTTGCAAKKLNRDFIGIEREEEYMKIAEARINSAQQMTMYGGTDKTDDNPA